MAGLKEAGTTRDSGLAEARRQLADAQAALRDKEARCGWAAGWGDAG